MIRSFLIVRRSIAVVVAVGLGACASGPVVTDDGDQAEVAPFATDAGEASYHLMLAELALERGLYAEASTEYRKAAVLSEDPEVAQRAVNLALELDRDNDALVGARRWVAIEPESIDAHSKLAGLLLRAGDVDDAVEQLETALPLFSSDPEQGFLPLTSIVLNEADAQRAVKTMSRLVAGHEDVAAAHYGLALTGLQHEDYELAAKHSREAERLRPEWEQAGILTARILVASGDVDAGLERASELARTSTDPDLRLDYALLLANLEREGEARLELDLLLDAHPRMPGALRAAGLLEMRRGDLDAAQLHFTSLLATGRNIWEAFFYLGSIAEEREQYARAVRYYTQVRDETLAVTAQVRAALLYDKLGEPERGIEHLLEFAGEAPRLDAELSIAAGELLAKRGERERALEIYEGVLQRQPGHRGARFAHAFLLEQMDQVDAAIRALRELLDETPDDPIALNALGYTLADRTDRIREAYKLIRKAYELDPDNPAIVDSMGWVQFRRGNADAAVEHLERAYGLLPDPEVAAHLVEVLWTLGRIDEAQAILGEALEASPGDALLTETALRLGM